jgi:hypothetical protein
VGRIGIKFVIVHLKGDIEIDHKTACDADGKPQYVYEGVNFLSFDRPQCNLQIISKHVKSPVDCVYQEGGHSLENLSPVPLVGKKSAMFSDIDLIHLIEISDKRFMFVFIG